MKTQGSKKMDPPKFSEFLKKCREAINLSIDDLAEESGAGIQVLREWEKGQALSLSLDYIRPLIRALKLEVSGVEIFLLTAKKEGIINEAGFDTLSLYS